MICFEKSKFFLHLQNTIEKTINDKLSESSNTLISDIYESLPVKDQRLLDTAMTPELLHSIFEPNKVTLSLHHKKKIKNKRIELNPKKRCLARIRLGKQCSRSRKIKINADMEEEFNTDMGEESEFCTVHLKSRPYGRIDEPIKGNTSVQKTGPGRKKKKNIAYSMEGLNKKDYIETYVIEFEGVKYLIDEYGILYSHDMDNSIVGQIKEDSICWFTQ